MDGPRDMWFVVAKTFRGKEERETRGILEKIRVK